MRIKLRTKVNSHFLEVKEGFTEKLFLKLNPPFPPVKLLEFGGCEKGDRVALSLNFFLFQQEWISNITFDRTTDSVFEFIDQGHTLPFFLSGWKHHHIVEYASETSAFVIDDIQYKTPFLLMDYLMYPILYLQFFYRKPIYKKFFRN